MTTHCLCWSQGGREGLGKIFLDAFFNVSCFLTKLECSYINECICFCLDLCICLYCNIEIYLKGKMCCLSEEKEFAKWCRTRYEVFSSPSSSSPSSSPSLSPSRLSSSLWWQLYYPKRKSLQNDAGADLRFPPSILIAIIIIVAMIIVILIIIMLIIVILIIVILIILILIVMTMILWKGIIWRHHIWYTIPHICHIFSPAYFDIW